MYLTSYIISRLSVILTIAFLMTLLISWIVSLRVKKTSFVYNNNNLLVKGTKTIISFQFLMSLILYSALIICIFELKEQFTIMKITGDGQKTIGEGNFIGYEEIETRLLSMSEPLDRLEENLSSIIYLIENTSNLKVDQFWKSRQSEIRKLLYILNEEKSDIHETRIYVSYCRNIFNSICKYLIDSLGLVASSLLLIVIMLLAGYTIKRRLFSKGNIAKNTTSVKISKFYFVYNFIVVLILGYFILPKLNLNIDSFSKISDTYSEITEVPLNLKYKPTINNSIKQYLSNLTLLTKESDYMDKNTSVLDVSKLVSDASEVYCSYSKLKDELLEAIAKSDSIYLNQVHALILTKSLKRFVFYPLNAIFIYSSIMLSATVIFVLTHQFNKLKIQSS